MMEILKNWSKIWFLFKFVIKKKLPVKWEKIIWVFEKLDQIKENSDPEEIPKLKAILTRFSECCDILSIVSFNGQRYDLPWIRDYLPLGLQKHDGLTKFVMKIENTHMALGTNRFRYCDLTNLAAGASLQKFYTAFQFYTFIYSFLSKGLISIWVSRQLRKIKSYFTSKKKPGISRSFRWKRSRYS